MPAAEASQWVDDTMPKVPRSSGRVPNDEFLRTVATVYRLRRSETNPSEVAKRGQVAGATPGRA